MRTTIELTEVLLHGNPVRFVSQGLANTGGESMLPILWVALGLIAVGAVVAVVAFLAKRKRRGADSHTTPDSTPDV